MSERAREKEKIGSEAGERLRAMFARWSKEEAAGMHDDSEPSWEEAKKALNEGRPADGKPFPEES